MKDIFKDVADETIQFCINKIKEDLPRDDYKEFLELIIIFLGGFFLFFKAPGAYHLA